MPCGLQNVSIVSVHLLLFCKIKTECLLPAAVMSTTIYIHVLVLTFDGEFVSWRRDAQLYPSSPLGVVAAAEVWHAVLTSLVHVHITRWRHKTRELNAGSHRQSAATELTLQCSAFAIPSTINYVSNVKVNYWTISQPVALETQDLHW